jgi:hypothetical protein
MSSMEIEWGFEKKFNRISHYETDDPLGDRYPNGRAAKYLPMS